MTPRIAHLAIVLLLTGLTGCGSTAEPGGVADDTGLELETAPIDEDALVEDTGAVQEDTGVRPDTRVADTNVATDTGTIDTSVMDTTVADTTVAMDTAMMDTAMTDTSAADGSTDPCVVGPTAGFVTIKKPEDLAALAAVTCITSGLYVESSTVVTLSLPKLQIVKGAVWINDNTSLTSASLPALRQVRDLRVNRNPNLASASFGALTTSTEWVQAENNLKLATLDVGNLVATGRLLVNGNTALTTLDVPKLTTLNAAYAGVRITKNAALTRVDLSGLVNSPTDLEVSDNQAAAVWLQNLKTSTGVSISGSKLTDLRMAALTRIDGYLGVYTPLLTDLELPLLTEVTGSLTVYGPRNTRFPVLTNVKLDLTLNSSAGTGGAARLDVLKTVGNNMTISGGAIASLSVPALTSIGYQLWVNGASLDTIALPTLTTLGSLYVSHAPFVKSIALANVDALPMVDALWIEDDAALETLSLPKVATAYRMIVRDAPKLTSFSMGALTSTKSMITFSNVGLTSLTLPALTAIGNDLTVTGNASLTSMTFPLLTKVEILNISISNNPVLTTIDMKGVPSIPYLTIVNNDALTNLNGFSGMRTVDTRLIIDRNDALTDVSGLYALTKVGELRITSNTKLPTATANTLRSEIPTITGTVTITGNAP
jgi:hypothetical protein